MGLLMLVMVPQAWWMPFHKVIPLPVSIIVMALGAIWFIVRALRPGDGSRAHASSCALMFVAMVWHLWAMQAKMVHSLALSIPAQRDMDHSHMDHHHEHHMGHGDMGDHWLQQAQQSGGLLWWFAAIGIPIMAALLILGLIDLVRGLRGREHRGDQLASAAMMLGMFWMSVGILTPILPFMGAFRI